MDIIVSTPKRNTGVQLTAGGLVFKSGKIIGVWGLNEEKLLSIQLEGKHYNFYYGCEENVLHDSVDDQVCIRDRNEVLKHLGIKQEGIVVIKIDDNEYELV